MSTHNILMISIWFVPTLRAISSKSWRKTERFHSLSIRLTDFTTGVLPSPLVVSYPVIGSNHPLAVDEIDFVPSPTTQPDAPTSSSSIYDTSHPSPHSQPGPFYKGKGNNPNKSSSHSQDMGQIVQSPEHVKRYRRYLISSLPLAGSKG